MDPSTSQRVEQQREYYEDRAAKFDGAHLGSRLNRCHLAKIRRIHQHLDVEPQHRVLEIGTGTGIHARWLLDRCPIEYVGIDLSPAMLAIARKRLGDGIELIEAAAEELPFDDGSFDAVYCSGTLHHVADKGLAIAEMGRVVRSGGRIVLSEPNPWNPLNVWAWATNRAERGQLEMRPTKLANWLTRNGNSIELIEFFNFTPPAPALLKRPYDVIDAIAARLPIARRVSSMLLVVATAAPPENSSQLVTANLPKVPR